MSLVRRCALLAIPLVSILFLGATSAGAALLPSATPTTSYSFTSAPGDPIGGGHTKSYSAPDATFSIDGAGPHSVAFTVTTSTENWRIVLAPPLGQSLQLGVYHDAELAEFTTGRAPGLDASGDGTSCDAIWGSFTINQIQTDSSGKVTVLDATFTQSCQSATAPPLNGTILYNALPISYLSQSDQGDSIGGGQTKTYVQSTSVLEVDGTLGIHAHVFVSGLRDEWEIELSPPTGQQLHVGDFANAQRFPDATHPGVDVSGIGNGCNSVTGSFTILDLGTDAANNITALSARFEQHCEGAAPALHGTIHILA